MSDRHKIDDIFKEGLFDHEVVPSFSTWDNIQYDLPEPLPFYKRLDFLIGTTTLLVLLLGLGFYSQQYVFNIDIQPKIDAEIATTTPIAATTNKATVGTETVKLVDATGRNANAAVNTSSNASTDLLASTSADLNAKGNLTANTVASTTPLNSLEKKNTSSKYSNQKSNVAIANFVAEETVNANDKHTNGLVITSSPFVAATTKQPVLKEDLALPVKAKNENGSIVQNISVVDTDKEAAIAIARTDKSIVSNPLTTLVIPNTITTVDLVASIDNKNIEQAFLLTDVSADLLVNKQTTLSPQIINNTTNIGTGLYFSTFGGINNTWIVNNEALKPSEDGSELSYRLDFGAAYGFALGYDVTDKFGVVVEWIVNSDQGQKFDYLAHGVIRRNTDISLKYTYVPVMLKYRLTKNVGANPKPVSINCLAGVQYGVLKSAEIPIDNPVMQHDLYKRNSWGFVMGVDYDLHLSSNYYVSLGGRASIATSSDGFSEVRFPGKNTSNNILFGLRAGLNYRFAR